jgi:phosphatidylglycerol:prolipoprotein diacylglycerol transferase
MPTGFNIGPFHIGPYTIGPLTIRYYGVILMLGALAGAFLAEREARRRKQPSDLVWDGLVWVLVGGVIGARIWHILTPPPSMVERGITTLFYLTHPLDAINIPAGGLGIPGAVIGGALALYWFSKRRKISFLLWVDIAAPALALGQAIGRWGNFVNQELYGKPTNLPWGITIDPANRLPEYMNVSRYHPLFLYESIWNLLNMGFLLWLARRYGNRLKNGDLLWVYMIFYPTGRFLLEFIRLDYSKVAGVNFNQAFMLVVAIAGAAILYLRHRQPVLAEVEPQEEIKATLETTEVKEVAEEEVKDE